MKNKLRSVPFVLGLFVAGNSLVLQAQKRSKQRQEQQPPSRTVVRGAKPSVTRTQSPQTVRHSEPSSPKYLPIGRSGGAIVNKGHVNRVYPRTGTPEWKSKVNFKSRHKNKVHGYEHDFYGRHPRKYRGGHHRSDYWVGGFWGPYVLSSVYQGIPVIDYAIDSPYEDCYVDIRGRAVCKVDNGWYYADVY
jgi:hypothetical protein